MKARSRAAVAFLFILSIVLPAPSSAQSPAIESAANGMSWNSTSWGPVLQERWSVATWAGAFGAADTASFPHADIRVVQRNTLGTDSVIYVIDASRNVLSVLDSSWAVTATFAGPRVDPDRLSIDPPDIPYFGRNNLATAQDRQLWTENGRANQ